MTPKNLLSAEGLHFILTKMVVNFTGFAPLGTVLVAQKGADLSVDLVAAPATVQAGSIANFTATVSHAGSYHPNGATPVIPAPVGVSSDRTLTAGRLTPSRRLHPAPGGMLPKWLANRANIDSVPALLQAVKRRAVDPNYHR